MPMTTIQTYFRINNSFVPMDQFEGAVPDMDYLEGAIVCRVNGSDIFKLEHWDLIDQLWAYIVDGLRKLDEGQDYDVFFPDQPLRLRFEVISPRSVKVSIGDETTKVDAKTFRSIMRRGAIEFFAKMKEINPEAIGTWERYQKEAEMVRV